MRSIVPPALRPSYDDWHFSPAIEANGIVWLAGCTGAGPDGVADDAAEQCRAAFAKAGLALEAADLGFGHVVEMTSYHVDIAATLEPFKAVKDEFLVEPWPAWTAIGVAALAVPGALVEIRLVAVRSPAREPAAGGADRTA